VHKLRTVTIARSREEIIEIYKEMEENAEKIGLEVNEKKKIYI
jgi:hypothetical protein